MPRNVTITLDEDSLRAAKVAAARRGLSLSALLRQELLRIAAHDERYEACKRAALRRLKSASARLGPGELPTRDELHDRDALR